MGIEILMFLVGLTLLYFGAEAMVQGSSALALRMGVTPLVVGLTVVAFGTSAPELLVSTIAVLTHSGDISLGNIVGSNIANIALILGCAAIIRPLEVHAGVVRRELPFMVGATGLLVAFAIHGHISRWEGLVLLAGMGVYMTYAFYQVRKGRSDPETAEFEEELQSEEADPSRSTTVIDSVKVVFGIVALSGGAYLMVNAARTIAEHFGVPELVIGVSIVALGTSLPELATSVVASYRGESDISVGNVIGSNIFNILLILGLVATISPLNVKDPSVTVDLWIMLGVSVGIYPILRTGHRVTRWEGAFLVLGYVAYIAYLFWR